MKHRRMFAVQVLFILLVLYALLVGGTFNGLVSTEISRVSLVMLTVGMIGWLVVRRRYGFRWISTPLDRLMLAGGGVLAFTTVFNLESWRRIAIGAWYWSLFAILWWLIADLVANGLPGRTLPTALLIGGLPVIVLGYVQEAGWLSEWIALSRTDISLPFVPPRPSSIIGNPNALGTYLIVVILLAMGRGFQSRSWLAQLTWGGYILAGGGLLFLSLSRGAWVGAAMGGIFWLVMVAAGAGMLSPSYWWTWWGQAGRARRLVAGLGLVAVLVAGVIAISVGFGVANQPGRAFQSTRAIVYHAAISEFLARPLTGSGLFTFGKDLLRYHSTPPQTPHSHAHNLFLHTGAQLGLPGLLLLGWLMWTVVRHWWARWRRMSGADRAEHVAAGAAILAVTVHHMFDITTMMPSLALVWLLLLAEVMFEHSETASRANLRWRTLAVYGLSAVLLTAGWGSQIVQERYFEALKLANSGDWRGGATMLRTVVNTDPALALYAAEEGYVWAVAAYRGDEAAAIEGIGAYQLAIQAEDEYAPWHANLAALRWQVGDAEGALDAIGDALERAPLSSVLWLNLGVWLEQLGDSQGARSAYVEVLDLSGAFSLPHWTETPLRRDVLGSYLVEADPTLFQETIDLLDAGDGRAAEELLLATPMTNPENLWWRVLLAIACEQQTKSERADLWLQSVDLYRQTEEGMIWLDVGRAVVAGIRDSDDAYDLYEVAREHFTESDRGEGFVYGENLAWFNFYRNTFSQQFVPQLQSIPADWRAADVLARLAS